MTTLEYTFGTPPDVLTIRAESEATGVKISFITLQSTTIEYVTDRSLLQDMVPEFFGALYKVVTFPCLFLSYIGNQLGAMNKGLIAKYTTEIETLATTTGSNYNTIFFNARYFHAILSATFVYFKSLYNNSVYNDDVTQSKNIQEFILRATNTLQNVATGTFSLFVQWLVPNVLIYVYPYAYSDRRNQVITGLSTPNDIYEVQGNNAGAYLAVIIFFIIAFFVAIYLIGRA